MEKTVFHNQCHDEMKVMKQVHFDGEMYVGTVDLGAGRETDVPASDALDFLLVAVNNNWIPCAHSQIESLNSSGNICFIHLN